MSAMQRSKFLLCDVGTLRMLRGAVAATFRENPARLPLLLQPPRTGGRAAALSTAFKRSDVTKERTETVCRLAFALWAGEMEQHRAALPIVVDMLVETLQAAEFAEQQQQQQQQVAGGGEGSPSTASTLLVAAFLCMRVVAVRIQQSNLAPFWPLVTAELLRVLAADGPYRDDLPVVLAAVQMLEVLWLLRPMAFTPFENVFTRPYVSPLAAERLEAARAQARGLAEVDAAMVAELRGISSGVDGGGSGGAD